MKKITFIYYLFILVILASCGGVNCTQLPKTYSSYKEAIKTIESTHYKIEETINTSKSSWIQEGSYYSCDGKVGFSFLKYMAGNIFIPVFR